MSVSRENDQRFDIDRASSAAARYLKDLDTMFSKKTVLPRGKSTIAVRNISERKEFVLGAFNAGEGRVAGAQRLAEKAGKDPRLWSDVQKFLALAGASKAKEKETREYVEKVLGYESEFAVKSPADKSKKQKKPRQKQARCFELPSRQAVAEFLNDFRAWCMTNEAAKLAHQVPTVALST